MKIWAHRGCSQMYPENTLTAFEKAMCIPGLTGIELDIQLTRDGRMVVIHDERVDRTTDGTGYVQDYTLAEIKCLRIESVDGDYEHIPEITEVLDLLSDRLHEGLKLNIELKNSNIYYDGMEEKIIALIHDYGLESAVIYSSFYAKSLATVRQLEPDAEIGVLDVKASDCLNKIKGGCGADAIHAFWKSIDLPPEALEGRTVRAWFSGHLFPEKPTGNLLDLAKLEAQGITDVFLNEPERYL